MAEATLLGVLGAAGGVLGAIFSALCSTPPACTCRRRPAITVSDAFPRAARSRHDDRLFHAGHRLARTRIHCARGACIAAANCGGISPCLASIASCAGFLLLFLALHFLLTCALVGHAAPARHPTPKRFSSGLTRFATAGRSYVVHVKITDYESGKPDEEHLYEVSQKGTEKTYVEFMSPREKGEHLLMLGDDMWVYLPDTSRPVRITPLERLTGDASNGDVARTNYAADYSPAYLRTEKVGRSGVLRPRTDRKAQGRDLSADPLLVRAEDARPVKAEFYLTSGKQSRPRP